MRKRFPVITTVIIATVQLLITSCNKYLDVVPKGQKTPTTFTDFDGLFRDEYTCHRQPIAYALMLLNDSYQSASNLNYYPLYNINYNWITDSNRITYNNSDDITYYSSYAGISNCNLLIEYVPGSTEATDAEKNTLVAQAKINRAMHYFTLVNYFADTYEASNAASKRAVPLITSADVNAPYTQVTVKEIYDFILSDVAAALPNLPDKGATPVHATKAAAYAFLARVYLQMSNYDKALESANNALAVNSDLFDWVAFYESKKSIIDQVGVYTTYSTPANYTYVENYLFRHGANSYSGAEPHLRQDRAAKFEQGDASLASRWKSRTSGSEIYFYSVTRGYFNHGGLTTTEMYLIKAECLARKNDITGAMQALNAVRVKRILPAYYTAATATDTKTAIARIRRTKDDALLFSIVTFSDKRRYNKEADYKTTLTKTENGKSLSLAPDSHMWTMPFPLGAITNAGNGTLEQNVTK